MINKDTYKRLTRRNEYGTALVKCEACYIQDKCDFTKETCCEELQDRLAELEDKIENGTLVELPLAVGDHFWAIHKLCDKCGKYDFDGNWGYERCNYDYPEYSGNERGRGYLDDSYLVDYVGIHCLAEVREHTIYDLEQIGNFIRDGDFGKKVFTTKAEAEARLKELQENNNEEY